MKRIAEMSDIKPILRKLPRIKKYLLNSDNIRWAKKKGEFWLKRGRGLGVCFSQCTSWGFMKWGICGKTTEIFSCNSPCLQSSSYAAHFVQYLNGLRNLRKFYRLQLYPKLVSDLCDFTDIVKYLPFVFHFKVPIRQIPLDCFETVEYSLVWIFVSPLKGKQWHSETCFMHRLEKVKRAH